MNAPQLEPGRTLVAITQNNDTVYDPPLRGLLVTGTGDVAIKVSGGAARTISVDTVPFYLNFWITSVMATNTNILDDDLHGYR